MSTLVSPKQFQCSIFLPSLFPTPSAIKILRAEEASMQNSSEKKKVECYVATNACVSSARRPGIPIISEKSKQAGEEKCDDTKGTLENMKESRAQEKPFGVWN